MEKDFEETFLAHICSLSVWLSSQARAPVLLYFLYYTGQGNARSLRLNGPSINNLNVFGVVITLELSFRRSETRIWPISALEY